MDVVKNKNKLFWVLQFSGWGIYWWSLVFSHSLRYGLRPRVIIWPFLTVCIGFALSLILRYLYKKLNLRFFSIIILVFIVLGITYVAVNIWYGVDLLFDPFMATDEIHAVPITIKNYLISIFYWWTLLFTWSMLYFLINFWIEWKQQLGRTEKANILAQKAQLQMLRYQLNPHFLFNSLNSIRALIEENEKNARTMITELSEFLRYSLISKNYSDVPLSNELDAIRHYFAIEKRRYEDKLDVAFEIDPLAEDYPVISFLIHPLVENAIKYGMRTSSMPLKIRIAAKVQNGELNIAVCNTGKWIKPSLGKESNENGTGTGLDNVRQRLENAFPNNHHLEVFEKQGEVHVRLVINREMN